MPLITWEESYSVKVPSIDEQHKKLIDMINELYEGVEQNSPHDALGSVLAQLINYTEMHFKYEEDLFQQLNYSLSEEHIAEHDSLKQQVYEIRDEFESTQSAVLSVKTTQFLKDWLLNHIMGTDMQYSDHFIQNDIK